MAKAAKISVAQIKEKRLERSWSKNPIPFHCALLLQFG
jgi:hypothetical protein